MADEGWESALKHVQDGNIREAHGIFERIVSIDVHNVSAWFWYAKTGASEAERTRILQNCLRFNPDSAETRQVLGLAPLPELPLQPAPSSSQPSSNSLTFTAAGSAARGAESGESTKPLKAYAAAPPTPTAVAAVVKSRVPMWIVLLFALLLIVFLAVAAWVAYASISP